MCCQLRRVVAVKNFMGRLCYFEKNIKILKTDRKIFGKDIETIKIKHLRQLLCIFNSITVHIIIAKFNFQKIVIFCMGK